MVEEAGGFVAFEPWAAQTPFETWIVPTFHQGSFGDLSDDARGPAARILIRTLAAVRRACGDPDFNLVMYSAPTNGGHTDRVFHWHLKLIPRLSTQAGFEIGSAMCDQHRRARGRGDGAPRGARDHLAAGVDPVRAGAERHVETLGRAREPAPEDPHLAAVQVGVRRAPPVLVALLVVRALQDLGVADHVARR